MERYPVAHSVIKEWELAVDQCCDQLQNLAADASLGFLYLTEHHANHLGDIIRKLKTIHPDIHWVGTVGMSVCSTNTEYSNQAAMVMMVTDLTADQYQLFSSPEEIEQHSDDIVQVAIVHGDPRNGQLADMISEFPDKHNNTYLVGGLTSAQQFFYQIADGIREGSLSGVLLNENVAVATGISQACSPIGQQHVVTQCDSNIAITIDHRPALDVFKEETGIDNLDDIQNLAHRYFFGFPITESDTGDYLVRNIMGIDPNSGAIAIGGYMQENMMLQFCERGDTTAVDDLKLMLEKLKKRTRGNIKGALYFTCLGRGMHMFDEQHRELELITETLGDIPLVGFYANGEIAGNHLYGYTGVMLLFT